MSDEPLLRLSVFFSVFVIMAVAESIAPFQHYRGPKRLRWFNNTGIVVISTLLVRLLCPVTAVEMAAIATAHHWGLLNLSSFLFPNLFTTWLSSSLTLILSIITLDLIIYGQHVLFHRVPWLWRLHKVHHADQSVDVTTGLRFHPLEILLSMGIKVGAIALLGLPATAVLMFELLLNATSLFNHGNVEFGKGDRLLRRFIVTPAMHRLHHSVHPQDMNRNFGFNLACWDRLFGTYLHTPSRSPQQMTMGLAHYPSAKKRETLLELLILPFLSPSSRRDSLSQKQKGPSESTPIRRST